MQIGIKSSFVTPNYSHGGYQVNIALLLINLCFSSLNVKTKIDGAKVACVSKVGWTFCKLSCNTIAFHPRYLDLDHIKMKIKKPRNLTKQFSFTFHVSYVYYDS